MSCRSPTTAVAAPPAGARRAQSDKVGTAARGPTLRRVGVVAVPWGGTPVVRSARPLRSSVLALFAAGVLFAATANGQPALTDQERAAARALADAGFELYNAGQYAEAYARFSRAEVVVHAPPHVLYMARSQAKLGKLHASIALYERIVAETMPADAPKAFMQAQTSAKTELAAVRARLPGLRVVLPAADRDAHVEIDAAPVAPDALAAPVLLDPGAHQIVVSKAGRDPVKRAVTLTDGGGITTVDFGEAAPPPPAPEPAPPPSPPPADDEAPAPGRRGPPTPAIAAFGVGAVGVGVGVVTGLLAFSKASQLKDACPRNPCSPDHETLADDARALGTVSTVGFVVGAVGVAAGVTLLVLRPGEPAKGASRGSRIAVRGTSLVLEGTFR